MGGSQSIQRELALVNASSAEELFSSIPLDYRDLLRPLLREIEDWVERKHEAMRVQESLEKHKAAKTFPPSLAGLKAPTFQFSKQYKDAGNQSAFSDQAAHEIDELKDSMLEKMIGIKAGEVQFYEEKLALDSSAKRLMRLVEEHWQNVVSKRAQKAVFEDRIASMRPLVAPTRSSPASRSTRSTSNSRIVRATRSLRSSTR